MYSVTKKYSVMMCIKTLICFLCSTLVKLDAARILAVFPIPSISHQIVFRPLTHELATRGHEVVVITTDPAFSKGKSPKNLIEIDVHDVSYTTWKGELEKITVGSNNDMDAQLKMLLRLFVATVERQLLTKEIQKLVTDKRNRFDLILVEVSPRPAIIYSYIFKAPVIQMSSFGTMVGTNSIVGAPNHPLLQPIVVRQRLYNLNLWEKVREIYRQYKFEYISYEHVQKENVIIKNIFGPDTPTVEELLNNVDMVFLNVHPMWNDNSPVPPGVIYMGGLHQQHERKLPEELLTYLESSENGIIYVSFGTNIRSSILPSHTIKIMMKVLSELPYNVIWKWDTDLPDKSRNIKVSKWLPQADLLRHPKVKLFITQGGLQSTDEAITGGVPLIGIPVIADQWYNVEKYIRLGIGKQLEMGLFTEEEFRSAVITVIGNQSFRDNIFRLRSIVRDQPLTSLERAAWWVEYVLRHGGAHHLRSPAADISCMEYFELELILIALAWFLLITTAFIATAHQLKLHIVRYCMLNTS